MFFVDNQAVAHAVGLLQVFGDHSVDIFQILAQVAVHRLVCQVDGAFEIGHFDVDPVLFVGRIGVVRDEGVLRALETVAFYGVHFGISLFRQVDAEIAARLGQVVVVIVARNGAEDDGQGRKQYGYLILHQI